MATLAMGRSLLHLKKSIERNMPLFYCCCELQ